MSAVTTVAEPLAPDDIDLGFVAQVVPELEIATIGDEKVVIGGATTAAPELRLLGLCHGSLLPRTRLTAL